MPKFRVITEFVSNYAIEIEAADEDAAATEAQKQLELMSREELGKHHDSDEGFSVVDTEQVED